MLSARQKEKRSTSEVVRRELMRECLSGSRVAEWQPRIREDRKERSANGSAPLASSSLFSVRGPRQRAQGRRECLQATSAAIERVASLKQDYQQRIAAAAPSDKERIANEAINALAKAVTDQGLSLEEYDSILEVAQNDPEVREKIRQRIRPSAK
jgi:Domain of unknown function (DUF4168)